MEESVKLYKNIVDGLVGLGGGAYRNWVLEKGAWPLIPEENKAINEFLSKLDTHDKEVLVGLLECARDSGIHDSLAFLYDRMMIGSLDLVENGVSIAKDPFGTEIYYDYVARREGDSWPDES